ncbi:MAG: PLP-dependent aminotransferase family protein [Acidobacteriota bacterium]
MVMELARRVKGLKASDIREILKLTQQPEMISFAGGLPAPELFPAEQMKEAAIRVLETAGAQALQYSNSEGYLPLREKIATRMRSKLWIRASASEILVTVGSQQGLDLSGKLFLDEGDMLFCESPTYVGAINAFQVFRPRFVEVPTDEEGMVIAELEALIARHGRPKFIYVIPDFQNPSGRTWSLDRRRQFIDFIGRNQIPVVEDCPYAELRYDGTPLPPLKALDTHGLVIFLGTFSKILSPGLRIGWLYASRALFDKLVVMKQSGDLHSSTLSQMQIAAYLDMCDIEKHIETLCRVYRQRRDAMIRTLEATMPESVEFTRPGGGLFSWVELPQGLNARVLLRSCLERNVAFVPGGGFFPNGGHEHAMRLNFSNMPPARIEEGIARLADTVQEALEARAAARDEPTTLARAAAAAR